MPVLRACAAAVVVMSAWWIVAYGFGSLPLTWLQPSWFPQLGIVATNGLALVAALGAAMACRRLGWTRPRALRELAALRGPRVRALGWSSPLLAVALSWIWVGRDGVPGIVGAPGTLIGSAAAMLAVGCSEEVASRGIALGAFLGQRAPLLGVVVTSTAFGLWHLGNGLFFGQPWPDTWWQVVGSAVFGMSLAGVRMVAGSVWPAVVLHAVQDWCQLNSPGAAPLWFQVAALLGELVWGCFLIAVGCSDGTSEGFRPGRRHPAIARTRGR